MKKKKIILIVGGIIITLVSVILFSYFMASDLDRYERFIKRHGYLANYKDDIGGVKYAYYDLDSDGKDELIVNISNNIDFGTDLFYRIEKRKIIFIDKIYHYGEVKYSKEEKAIIYTDVRPSLSYGWVYSFDKVGRESIDKKFNLIVKINDNKSKYYKANKDQNEMEITEEEYNKYINKSINFDYKRKK